MAVQPIRAGAVRQTETQKHFAALWANREHQRAIGLALANLADTLEKDLSKPGVMELYIATLADLSPQECILAFSRAAEQTERWFPSPGQLRRYAGRVESVDGPKPGELDATKALSSLIEVMRKHGPTLRTNRGPLIRDRDENGFCITPEYGPSVPPPALPDATERALLILGLGNRQQGLWELAAHPALLLVEGKISLEEAEKRQRVGQNIMRRWLEAYAQAVRA